MERQLYIMIVIGILSLTVRKVILFYVRFSALKKGSPVYT
jgi:hypothetical protein